jgi:hypothetical protein
MSLSYQNKTKQNKPKQKKWQRKTKKANRCQWENLRATPLQVA